MRGNHLTSSLFEKWVILPGMTKNHNNNSLLYFFYSKIKALVEMLSDCFVFVIVSFVFQAFDEIIVGRNVKNIIF